MKKKIKNIFQTNIGLGSLLLVVLMSSVVGAQYISAAGFTQPPCSIPANCNTYGPVDVGPTGYSDAGGQIKSNALEVNGFQNDGGTILVGSVAVGYTTPHALLDVYGTGKSPSLTSDAGIFQIGNNVTQALTIGADPNAPFDMWLQTKRVANDNTSWPLSLNPLGGNVGIGTTNPTASLEVYSAAPATTANLKLTSGGNDRTPRIRFNGPWSVSNPSESYAEIEGINDNGGPGSGATASLHFLTSSGDPASLTDKMTILGNGNVGIGTTAPAYPLDVGLSNTAATGGATGINTNGTIRSGVTTGGTGGMWVEGTAANASNQFFGSISSTTMGMYIGNSWRLGLSNTGDVEAARYCDLNDSNCITPPGSGGGGLTGGVVNTIPKWTGASTLGNSPLTIDSNSVVYSPYAFVVGKTPVGTINLYQGSAAQAGYIAWYRPNENGFDGVRYGYMGWDQSNTAYPNQSNLNLSLEDNANFTITNDNAARGNNAVNVGIGNPSPFGPLDVTVANDDIVMYEPATNALAIQTALDGHWSDRSTYATNQNNLILQPDAGNVGIGTNSPGAKLDVNGNLSFGGNTTAALTINSGYGAITLTTTGTGMGPQQNIYQYDPTLELNDPSRGYANLQVDGILYAKSGICIGDDSATCAQQGGLGQLGSVNSGTAKFYVDGTIQSSGNLRALGNVHADGQVSATTGICLPNSCVTSWTQLVQTYSDIRLKQDIAPLQDALTDIMKLKPVTYEYKDQTLGKGQQVGLIAQDVEKVYPQVVTTEPNGMKAITYGNLVAPLIEAMQEQQQEINDLKAELTALQAQK